MKKVDKICCIYKITSPDNKIYIGATKNFKVRMRQYKTNCKGQYKVNESVLIHGLDSHKFEIIHRCNYNELDILEKYYIKKFDTFETEHGLNLTNGGKIGYKGALESNKKRALSKVGHKATPETIEKLRVSHLGQKLRPESIEKRQATRKEKGIRPSDEQKAKVSESVKKSWEKRNRVVSEETKIKMKAGHDRRRLLKQQGLL